MKSKKITKPKSQSMVAPLVGAWIEINSKGVLYEQKQVAPLVGAWIEIVTFTESLPAMWVAPLVGAWIEIYILFRNPHLLLSLLL